MKLKAYLLVLSGVFAHAALTDSQAFFKNIAATGGGNLLGLALVIAVPFGLYALLSPSNPNALIQSRELRPEEKTSGLLVPGGSETEVNIATGLDCGGGLDTAGNPCGFSDDKLFLDD